MEGMQRIEAGLLERYDATITRHRERPDADGLFVRWWVRDTHRRALKTTERFLVGAALLDGALTQALIDRLARTIIARWQDATAHNQWANNGLFRSPLLLTCEEEVRGSIEVRFI